MIAYISVSFSQRMLVDDEIKVIKDVLKKFKIESFVFVDAFTFDPSQEKEMMQEALLSIDKCDLLIAETSHKGIGIGIEAGYAKAKKKPVIYIRRNTAEHSTTLSGVSDFQIVYREKNDLRSELTLLLSNGIFIN